MVVLIGFLVMDADGGIECGTFMAKVFGGDPYSLGFDQGQLCMGVRRNIHPQFRERFLEQPRVRFILTVTHDGDARAVFSLGYDFRNVLEITQRECDNRDGLVMPTDLT